MPTHAHWTAHVRHAWLHRGWLARLLWPASQLYATLVAMRRMMYRSGWIPVYHARVPVVMVGNVVAGGAGKTPVVISVVQHLLRKGHQPGVVSRGYGREPDLSAEAPIEVHPHSNPRQTGDEPLLIQRATGVPVVVARQRRQAVEQLLALHPNTTVIVCDDGLQHLALHADVSIAVFDERGTGNGWLLPAGLLREPWPHGTGRHIDLVLQALPFGHSNPQAVNAPGERQPVHTAAKTLADSAYNPSGKRASLQTLAQSPTMALAGIAKPEVFFNMLRERGLQLTETWSLPDHFIADHKFCSELFKCLKRQDVLLTEKDAVKLFSMEEPAQLTPQPAANCSGAVNTGEASPHDLWAVPLVVDIEPAFFDMLDAKLSSRHGHQTA